MVSDKLTPEDVAAAVKGSTVILNTLSKIFPEASAQDLFDHASAIADSPVAQLLLHQLLVLRKLPLA